MSHVSSMIVTCKSTEDAEDDLQGGLATLHAWCAALERPIRFRQLDDSPACNGKAMQMLTLAAAVNYFDEDALLEAFPTFPWLFPENALLVIYPEHGGPRIARGDGERFYSRNDLDGAYLEGTGDRDEPPLRSG